MGFAAAMPPVCIDQRTAGAPWRCVRWVHEQRLCTHGVKLGKLDAHCRSLRVLWGSGLAAACLPVQVLISAPCGSQAHCQACCCCCCCTEVGRASHQQPYAAWLRSTHGSLPAEAEVLWPARGGCTLSFSPDRSPPAGQRCCRYARHLLPAASGRAAPHLQPPGAAAPSLAYPQHQQTSQLTCACPQEPAELVAKAALVSRAWCEVATNGAAWDRRFLASRQPLPPKVAHLLLRHCTAGHPWPRLWARLRPSNLLQGLGSIGSLSPMRNTGACCAVLLSWACLLGAALEPALLVQAQLAGLSPNMVAMAGAPCLSASSQLIAPSMPGEDQQCWLPRCIQAAARGVSNCAADAVGTAGRARTAQSAWQACSHASNPCRALGRPGQTLLCAWRPRSTGVRSCRYAQQCDDSMKAADLLLVTPTQPVASLGGLSNDQTP